MITGLFWGGFCFEPGLRKGFGDTEENNEIVLKVKNNIYLINTLNTSTLK
jgi:hypothetical protein